MNVRAVVFVLGFGVSVGTGAAVAQDSTAQDSVVVDSAAIRALADVSTTSTRLARTLPAGYAEPPCFNGTNQRQVKRALESFKAALESKTIEGRLPELEKAESAILEAIEKEKQSDNAAAWYTLGQLYLYRDNAVGADTALRRASELAPGCRDVVGDLREMAWFPLMNGGIALARADERDSALVLFRKADRLSPEKPLAAMNVGIIFANTSQPDSAAVYLERAASLAEAAEMIEERNRATFNLGVVLQQVGRHADAVKALQKYVQWAPDDIDAKNALTASYRAVGDLAKAQEIEQQLLASVEAGDSGAVGGAGASHAAPLAAVVAMRTGVDAYNEKRYADAAEAFRKVIELEPNNRDAIYNLANVYLAMKNGTKLVETGARLIQIEPMSEDIHHLVGSAYKMVGNIDQAIKIAEAMLALPADVAVKEFMTRADGVKLTMTATGREAQTAEGKPIKPKPVALVFEFLDREGVVVTTKEAEVPALKPPETRELTIEAKGKGILAWRYTRK